MRLLGYALAILGLFTHPCQGFYLPGVAPRDFGEADKVELKVNKLTSVHTQLPINYYSMPFCIPKNGIKHYAENLGEFLTGDRIQNSPYSLYMKHTEACKVLCEKVFSSSDAETLKEAIGNDYHHNWILDNLPAARRTEGAKYVTNTYSQGFPIGFQDREKYYIYNHVHIIVNYHPMTDAMDSPARVVGFYVEPFSVQHSFKAGNTWTGDTENVPPLQTCDGEDMEHPVKSDGRWQQVLEDTPTLFTYDVEWKVSSHRWASRWDIYLDMDNAVPAQVHWFSIVNSLLIVILLTAMIAMILLRTLYRDISLYNRIPTDEERADEREETGWKLVHADVFRPPTKYPMLFCVSVGTGMQLVFMSLATILFAAIGFLSPANRGSLMIAVLLLYVLFGAIAGYCSATLYKTFKGKQWQRCTFLTAFLYPGVCFAVFFLLDLVTWAKGSTQAVPFFSMLALLALWFGISVPLVFLGAYLGYKSPALEFPVVTSNIPRQIPDQPWFLQAPFTIGVGGILPFGAVFVEMFFILSSIWMGQYYYVFGFLFLVFLILLITCADITMVFCYFQLCSEDYNWWWRSFLTAASTAAYVFIYSGLYFAHLESNMMVTYMLYFGYMGVLCLGMGMMCGAIGFYSCLAFTRKIYGSVKVD